MNAKLVKLKSLPDLNIAVFAITVLKSLIITVYGLINV